MKAKWQNTYLILSVVSYWQEVKYNGVALVIFCYYSACWFYKHVYRLQKTLTVSFKHPLINIAGGLWKPNGKSLVTRPTVLWREVCNFMKIMGSFVYYFSWLIYEYCKKNTLKLYHVLLWKLVLYVLITSRGAIETSYPVLAMNLVS